MAECRNMCDEMSTAVSFHIAVPPGRKLITYDQGSRVFASAIHRNSQWAATAGHNGTHVWELETGQQLYRFDHGCFLVAFIADNILYDAYARHTRSPQLHCR